MHPQEVALLCGLFPTYVAPNPSIPLRLNLEGVGQMASPLQSSWLMANVLHQLGLQRILPCQPTPQQRLGQLLLR